DVLDNYGQRMRGYLVPPITGDYIFWLASDDGGELFLSMDESPVNKKLIAQETGWSPSRSFEAVGGGSLVEDKNSSTFAGTGWPTLDPANGGARITLQQGRSCYIEALMKEGNGGDNLAVRWRMPDGTDQAPIIASNLLPWGISLSAPAITE